MPAYRVDIDGRIYEGYYSSKANAVYGCMIKDMIDISRNTPYEYRRSIASSGSLIGVEEIRDRKVTKKVHRVDNTNNQGGGSGGDIHGG